MELRIKEILNTKRIKVSLLADEIGMTRESLSRIINGANTSIETLQKIADALEVEIWELFTASTSGELVGFVEYRGTIFKIQSIDDWRALNKVIEADKTEASK